MAFGVEFSVEHDVTIQKRADGVNERILLVVAFHEHGIEGGDASASEISSAFNQSSQQREDRRRVAFGGGRFAGGEADFALGHGESRERIHDEQDIFALRTKIFGYGGGGQRRANAQQRRLVGGGNDDDRTSEPVFANRIFEKFPDFPAAFADQGKDREIGAGTPSLHADERTFPNAAASEDTDALSAAAGQHAVDGTDAAAKGFANGLAVERRRRITVERLIFARAVGRQIIERFARPIDHAAQNFGANAQRGMRAAGDDAVAITDATGAFQRHGKHGTPAKADNFTGKDAAVLRENGAAFADAAERTVGFDQMSDGFGHTASPAQRREVLEPAQKRFEIALFRHHCVRGRCSSRSKKPCSISLSWVSRLICVLPTSVSSAHSPCFNAGSPINSGDLSPPCWAKYSFQKWMSAGFARKRVRVPASSFSKAT